MDLNRLVLPIVQAPMAGGPSTPALAAAVSNAGGLGFLAAGYRSVDALDADLSAVRELTAARIGVNLFAAPAPPGDPAPVREYARLLQDEARRHGAALGEPRWDDDALEAKLELLLARGIDVISFTFGCPPAATVARLHDRGCDVWVTVTTPAEGREAERTGADVLVAQGAEAGGHRGSFRDDGGEDFGLLALLRLLASATTRPLVGAGAIMDGAGVAAVLCAGASAAALGTALMLTPEAATPAPHRAALAADRPTRLTRAFSGRLARGVVNRFMDDHDADAPPAYPQVHHLTSPMRAAARAAGDGEALNLWAGQAHTLAREAPAGELVRAIGAEAREVAERVRARLGDGA